MDNRIPQMCMVSKHTLYLCIWLHILYQSLLGIPLVFLPPLFLVEDKLWVPGVHRALWLSSTFLIQNLTPGSNTGQFVLPLSGISLLV